MNCILEIIYLRILKLRKSMKNLNYLYGKNLNIIEMLIQNQKENLLKNILKLRRKNTGKYINFSIDFFKVLVYNFYMKLILRRFYG